MKITVTSRYVVCQFPPMHVESWRWNDEEKSQKAKKLIGKVKTHETKPEAIRKIFTAYA